MRAPSSLYWSAARSQGHHLPVENHVARGKRASQGHDFGNGDRHVPQVSREHAHLVVDFVHLDARAVEFVFERRLAERRHRIADIGGRIREHRLDRLKRPEKEARESRVAFGERHARDRR